MLFLLLLNKFGIIWLQFDPDKKLRDTFFGLKTMQRLKRQVGVEELREIASVRFKDLIKAVVDIDRGLVAIDAELHSDLEALLLEDGSKQKNLWGINFYPDLTGDDFIEFDSMINIRPAQGNMSRGVDNSEVRQKIIEIVNKWVKR